MRIIKTKVRLKYLPLEHCLSRIEQHMKPKSGQCTIKAWLARLLYCFSIGSTLFSWRNASVYSTLLYFASSAFLWDLQKFQVFSFVVASTTVAVSIVLWHCSIAVLHWVSCSPTWHMLQTVSSNLAQITSLDAIFFPRSLTTSSSFAFYLYLVLIIVVDTCCNVDTTTQKCILDLNRIHSPLSSSHLFHSSIN